MTKTQYYVTQPGALYSVECDTCGATLYSHEWCNGDHNARRDGMEAGWWRCDECGGRANPETFSQIPGRFYALVLEDGSVEYGEDRDALVQEFTTTEQE